MADLTGHVWPASSATTKDASITVCDPAISAGSEVVQENTVTTRSPVWWRRLLGLFWDSVDGDPRDRRYVQKLDSFLLCVTLNNPERELNTDNHIWCLALTYALGILLNTWTSRITASVSDQSKRIWADSSQVTHSSAE